MDNALETLALAARAHDGRAAFLNARYHPFLERFDKSSFFAQQWFKPYARELEARGFRISPSLEAAGEGYDAVYILAPKNALEARALLAQGASMLRKGGVLICAADNKAGGTRLEKILKEFELSDIGALSKNHARAAWGIKDNINSGALEAAIREGAMRRVTDQSFISQPGIFAWDKIDKGSAILAQRLPDELPGRGADFGCGYGYLAQQALSRPGVEKIYCADADWRAAEACRKNMAQHEGVEFLWEDLTRTVPALKNLDWIVMNPPFHEGKETDASIGASFIDTAAASLKSGGVLWMVANAGLPYEKVLGNSFSSVEKIYEGQGYKIYRAVK